MSCINHTEHKYIYKGVGYCFGRLVPGSGASYIEYFDVYYCQKCLHIKHISLGEHGTSYEPVKFNATPVTPTRVSRIG